eukprot:11467439-Karenia_brevis.AAC.1
MSHVFHALGWHSDVNGGDKEWSTKLENKIPFDVLLHARCRLRRGRCVAGDGINAEAILALPLHFIIVVWQMFGNLLA